MPAYTHPAPYESRADHEYSYRVEVDLARLLAGSHSAVPADGLVIGIHWLVQVGDEPDIKVDRQMQNCRLQLVAGQFEPVDKHSRDQLDENIAFEKRTKAAEEYREFELRESDGLNSRHQRLATAVRGGDIAATLRVLAEDLCFWAGNLKPHLIHQVAQPCGGTLFCPDQGSSTGRHRLRSLKHG